MVLKVLGVGRGIVAEPGQGIIDALGGKRGQRVGAVVIDGAHAVHDIVVGRGQIRHVEDIAQGKVQRAFLRDRDVGLLRNGEMHRHRRGRGANGHRHTMVFGQKGDLLPEVAGEQVGPGDGRGIGPGFGHMAKAEAAVGLGEGRRGQPDLGIIGAIAGIGDAIGDGGREPFRQKPCGDAIQLHEAVHGGAGIAEGLGRGHVRRKLRQIARGMHERLHRLG